MAYLFEQKILNEIFDDVAKALRTTGVDKEAYYLFETSYIGINSNPDAATSATDWTIYYITDSLVKKKTGSWDNRATMF